MDPGVEMREDRPASADAALVEAARGAPAAFYQFHLTPSGAYVIPFASPDFAARLGIELGKPEETAARFFSRVHPDDLAPISDAIMGSARTLEAFKSEFRFRLPSGAEAWIEARSNPQRMPDGGVSWNGILTDITARKKAEAALRESEERFRTLVETSFDWVWEVDAEGRYTHVSPRSVDILGYAAEEILGKTPFDFMQEDEARRVGEIFGAIAADKKPFNGLVNVNLHKSGRRVVLETSGVPVIGPGGEFRGYRGTDRDITAQKNAEAALRESEESYRRLFTANPQPMWFFDTKTLAFLEVNDAAVAFYGFRRDEFLAMTIADIRPPEDVPRLRSAVGWIGEGTIDLAGTWRHRKKDGSIILVEITSHPVEYDRRPAEVVLVHDITTRMNAQAGLRESEQRFRAIFEVAPVGVAQADPATGRWLAVNPRMCLITGYTEDELLAMRIPELTHPEDRARDWDLFQRVVKGEAPEYRIEKRYLRKNGSFAWVNVNMVVLRDAEGRPTRTLAMIEDITERKRAHEALRASEERFRAMFELAPVGVAQAELPAGKLVAVNPKMSLITGYPADELLAMRVEEITHPDDREQDRKLFQSLVRGEAREARIEKRYVRKDGTIAWGIAHVVVLRDAEGRPTRSLATIEDITDRKANETKLARLNSELAEALESQRQIFEGSRDAVFLSDGDGRFVAVNGAAADLTGYSREELLAMSIPDLHDDLDLKAYRTFHHRILDGEQVLSEAPIRRKDGTKVTVEFNNSFVVVGGRRLVHTAGRDITERKKAVETLAASETRYRALFENAAEGIIAIDPDSMQFLFFNPALCAMFGYAPEEFGRLTVGDIHPKEAIDEVRGAFRSLAGGSPVVSPAVSCLRKDRTTFVADIHASTIEIAGRKVVFGFFTDVTDRARLEEQLRQAQKMEAIGQLAGGVAHDFNNLLTVISGNTELLLSDSRADDPKRGPLTDIRAAGERAANLTRQLLAFSRKQILEPKLVDVNEAVIGIEKMLRRLIGEDVDIVTDLAADPSWVKVDPGQLEQVVMNLVVNARDAMPRGGRITIRTRTLDPKDSVDAEESAGRHARPRVALSISDTGTGIAPEVKAHIFEPFFTTKGVGKGTGLGLATVFGIVKQSGGDVMFESEPGKGATFTVILPSQPAPRRRGASGASLRVMPRGTETVLVVEDEDAVRRIVKIALESAGYRIIEARSGSEALEAVRQHAGTIHLVVTDVVMPEMSGRELAERIVKTYPAVKILYMSGYTDDAVMRHGIVESGVFFLQKPFSPLALARKVREVLDEEGA
jgi:PAS domain S-box-containing protein